MEDRFGFNISQRSFDGPAQVQENARRSIQSGSDDLDLAMMTALQALPLAQQGLFERLDDMPHIDLTAPWWDQDMVRDFSIGNRLFFSSSDFTFNHYSATIGVIFNKELHAGLALDCPYRLVREGRWTIDRFAEMGREALADLNGDGIFDRNDQWGMSSTSFIYVIAFMAGVDARYIVKDADDIPSLNATNENFIYRFNALFDILTESWVYDRSRPGMAMDETEKFQDGRVLFHIDLLNWATRFRGMDTDFGIIPMPKLNEQQEHYMSGTGQPEVMCIPVTTENLDRAGIIIEALSAESRLTTLSVYFDTMLVNQIMNRDDESADMLDLIFGNRIYEIGRQYWSGTVADPIANAFRDRSSDIASIMERQSTAANRAIETTINAFLGD
jgi:ABC-type glycerol-3-phosphate transport system substrate-binding protein